MARQNGIHFFIGKLASTRGFKMKQQEGWFEGLTGGASAEQIANDPNFARTRENMAEFGGSALAGKRYRDSQTGFPTISDVIATGRLLAIMAKIKNQDVVSPRGERRIDINANPSLLIGYEWNRFDPVSSIAAMPSTFTTSGMDSAALGVPSFTPTDFMAVPAGATHVIFFVIAMVMSNYIFDVNDPPNYTPENTANNGSQVLTISSLLSVNNPTGPFTVTATVPVPASDPTQSLVGSWGCVFFQQVGANFNRLFQNDCGTIGDIQVV